MVNNPLASVTCQYGAVLGHLAPNVSDAVHATVLTSRRPGSACCC
jgi:hypothetical protein